MPKKNDGSNKYMCPDCGTCYMSWSECRAHLIASNHANPENTKGLQQRCMIAKAKQLDLEQQENPISAVLAKTLVESARQSPKAPLTDLSVLQSIEHAARDPCGAQHVSASDAAADEYSDVEVDIEDTSPSFASTSRDAIASVSTFAYMETLPFTAHAAADMPKKKRKKDGSQKDGSHRYMCPDCGMRFLSWSECRTHLIASSHADPGNTKGLQQRCMIAKPIDALLMKILAEGGGRLPIGALADRCAWSSLKGSCGFKNLAKYIMRRPHYFTRLGDDVILQNREHSASDLSGAQHVPASVAAADEYSDVEVEIEETSAPFGSSSKDALASVCTSASMETLISAAHAFAEMPKKGKKYDRIKYMCPECRLYFISWSECRTHLISSNHANPENPKGLQQRCMIAKAKLQLDPRPLDDPVDVVLAKTLAECGGQLKISGLAGRCRWGLGVLAGLGGLAEYVQSRPKCFSLQSHGKIVMLNGDCILRDREGDGSDPIGAQHVSSSGISPDSCSEIKAAETSTSFGSICTDNSASASTSLPTEVGPRDLKRKCEDEQVLTSAANPVIEAMNAIDCGRWV